LVVEVGLSESLRRLRADAAWWLVNSSNDVKIVLIFSLGRSTKMIVLEKWECVPMPARPATRANQNPAQNPLQVPTKVQTIEILETATNTFTISRAPLILSFENLFLRTAQPPEADFEFTDQDLTSLAIKIWR
jgi:hypothetical protein